MTETPKRRGGRWTRWLTLAVGLALLGWVLSRVSWPQLVEVLREADLGLLAAAVAASLLATAFRCLRYAQFFPNPSRARNVFGAFAYMRLLNLVMPMRTGEVASLGLLKTHGLAPSIAETLPVWLVLRLSDVFGLAVWLVPAVFWVALPELVPGVGWLMIGLLLFASLTVAGVVVAMRSRVPESRSWLHGRLEEFRRGLLRVRSAGQMARVAGLAIGVSASMIAINAAGQMAFGSPLSWPMCWLISALVLGVTMLPIHGPFGLGTLEVSWVGFMGLYDVPVGQAVGIALGLRLLTLAIILIDGALGSILLAVPATQPAERS